MKRLVLAALAALSLPAAALAHGEVGYGPAVRPLPPAPPAYAERRELADLRQLVSRLDGMLATRSGRRQAGWIEAELLRACEREIAEARVAAARWHEIPGSRRSLAVTWGVPARTRLDSLLDVRAGLAALRWREDWRSIRQARDLGAELVRLAALDVRYDAPPPPPPAWGHDRDDDHGRPGRHGRHG